MAERHWYCVKCGEVQDAIGFDLLCVRCWQMGRSEGLARLRTRTPEERAVYYQIKYALWRVEKRVLTEKLKVALTVLNKMGMLYPNDQVGRWAKDAIREMEAIGEAGSNGQDMDSGTHNQA